MKKKIFNIKDIFIIGTILILCAVFIIYTNSGKHGKYAVISVDGNVKAEIPLDVNKQNITVDSAENISFEVKNGRICVSVSDCTDGICKKSGYISRNGQTIVCLPKKVTVNISDSTSDADVTVG